MYDLSESDRRKAMKGGFVMWIKIDDVDRTDEILNHYIDNKTNLVEVRFKGKTRNYYNYSWNRIEIGPSEKIYLDENEWITYKGARLDGVSFYEKIGDNVKINGTYYKQANIEFHAFKLHPIQENQGVVIKGERKTVSKIEMSKDLVRITFEGEDQPYLHPYDRKNISFESKNNYRFVDLLSYYKKIASVKDSSMDSDSSEVGYLEKQINDMVIQDDDALNAFFTKNSYIYEETGLPTIYPFGINLSQRVAIKNVATHQLSLIQGPPGTGKTRSILNILANLIIQGKTAAVVSSNNEAVKNVHEKMVEDGYGFLLAMLGKKENRTKFFDNQSTYPEELYAWERSPEEMLQLLKDIEAHETTVVSLLEGQNRLSEIEFLLSEYKHEYKYFGDYLAENQIQKLRKFNFFKLDDQKLLELIVDLDYLEITSFGLRERIVSLFKYGIYQFKQFEELEAILLDLQKNYYERKILDLKHEQRSIEENLKTNNFDDEMKQLEEKSMLYFRGYLANRFNSQSERIKFSGEDYYKPDVFKQFILEYPIILSTTHAIAKSKDPRHKFDYLIVDEASQVELVPGIIALNTASNAIIVGDLKQLPHIPDSKVKEHIDEWNIQYSISEPYDYGKQSLLSAIYHLFGDEVANVMLQEHYRCHSRIIGFCNKKYYNGELICHTKNRSKNPLVLLKTVKGNHMRIGEEAVNRITNIRELESLRDEEFLESIDLNFEAEKSFGFVAPFRGQTNAAKNILPEDFQKDTVHKFQGRECDVIMFSSVLDQKWMSKRYLNFVDEPSLINVAVSRAKEKFILVSDVDVFKQSKGEINDLIRYMEYYEDDSQLHQSKVRSIFDLMYSDYKEELERKRRNPNWKISKYDSENLGRELIERILLEKGSYKYTSEVRLKELIRDDSLLTTQEKQYARRNSRVDFLIYNKFDNQPVLAIEIDGYHYHENNPKQCINDALKNSIFEKYAIPLVRLATNHSGEEEKILSYL